MGREFVALAWERSARDGRYLPQITRYIDRTYRPGLPHGATMPHLRMWLMQLAESF